MSHSARVAAALVVGILGSLVVMALHPTGPDVLASTAAGRGDALARSIHAAAIGLQPLLAAGYLGLALSLPRRDLAILGFAAYAVATTAVVGAATLSGLVVTPLLESTLTAGDAAKELILTQARFAFLLNQGFTKVFVSLAGVAIGCWSLAMRGDVRFPAGLRWLGIALAVAGVGGIAAGKLALDVLGFGLIVLAQASWTCWSAACLARHASREMA